MKIIDKKGKLFGLINIIDLIFILIVIVAIVGGAKKLGGTRIVNEGTKKGQVTYMVYNVRKVTADNIRIGDQLRHYDKGTYIGEIVDKKVEAATQKTDWQGKWTNAELPDRYTVFITVDCEIGENDQTYTVGGEQTKIGGEYRMKTKTSAFFGTCMGISLIEGSKMVDSDGGRVIEENTTDTGNVKTNGNEQ